MSEETHKANVVEKPDQVEKNEETIDYGYFDTLEDVENFEIEEISQE